MNNRNSDYLIVTALPEEIPTISNQNNILITGVGKVNASIKLTKKLTSNPNIRTIINFGTAGCVDKSLNGLVECNTFIEGERNDWTETIEMPRRGITCCTQDFFATSNPDKKCDVLDMEAYALAKVCKELGRDFYCYKFISDYIGNENQKEDWEDNISNGEELFIDVLSNNHNIEVIRG